MNHHLSVVWRATPLACVLALSVSAGAVLAQNGLVLDEQAGAHRPVGAVLGDRTDERSLRFGLGELRLDLSVARLGTSQARARLLGDYYLIGTADAPHGGLRLTSGLTLAPSETAAALPPTRLEGGLQWGRHDAFGMLPWVDRPGARVALPYIGLGYTSLAPRVGGWGLSADIGLGGMRPGERVRFGAGNPTAAQVEDVLNSLRLAPVLQVGVSYAF